MKNTFETILHIAIVTAAVLLFTLLPFHEVRAEDNTNGELPTRTKIDTPQNIHWSDDSYAVSWDPVENASGYIVSVYTKQKYLGTSGDPEAYTSMFWKDIRSTSVDDLLSDEVLSYENGKNRSLSGAEFWVTIGAYSHKVDANGHYLYAGSDTSEKVGPKVWVHKHQIKASGAKLEDNMSNEDTLLKALVRKNPDADKNRGIIFTLSATAGDESTSAFTSLVQKVKDESLQMGWCFNLDLAASYKDTGEKITDITETDPLQIKVPVPEGIQKDGRTFLVYRDHDGSVDLVGRNKGTAVIITTGKFSPYIMAYTDAPTDAEYASYDDTQEGNDTAAAATSMGEKKDEPYIHVHHYIWQVISQATTTDDGEMAYVCNECGDRLYRVPISAYSQFNIETQKKIQKAKAGSTVVINAAPDRLARDNNGWMSLHRMVYDAITARSDVTVKLDYRYKGTNYEITIPGGMDFSSLYGGTDYIGFLKLGTAIAPAPVK